MEIEFLEDGVEGRPMVLLYGGGSAEVSSLRDGLRSLSARVGRQPVLNDLTFVRSVGECRLRATCAEKDFGVVARAPADFEWILDPESWLQVEELLEPFCEEKNGVYFQHLNPVSGPEVLYSTARQW